MRMEALRQTNYVKYYCYCTGRRWIWSAKASRAIRAWMCARLLAFSNGDLQALFDRSDGFYRRQLVLTTKKEAC